MDAATRRRQLYTSTGHPQSCLHIRSKRFITHFLEFSLGQFSMYAICGCFTFIVTIRGCSWFVVESKIVKLCVWFSESEWNGKLDTDNEMYGFNLCRNVPIKCHINTRHFDFYFYSFDFLRFCFHYCFVCLPIFNIPLFYLNDANCQYVTHFKLPLPKNIQ